jgi:hypothetical protein
MTSRKNWPSSLVHGKFLTSTDWESDIPDFNIRSKKASLQRFIPSLKKSPAQAFVH